MLYWINYKSDRCTTIESVNPHQLQATTARTVSPGPPHTSTSCRSPLPHFPTSTLSPGHSGMDLWALTVAATLESLERGFYEIWTGCDGK